MFKELPFFSRMKMRMCHPFRMRAGYFETEEVLIPLLPKEIAINNVDITPSTNNDVMCKHELQIGDVFVPHFGNYREGKVPCFNNIRRTVEDVSWENICVKIEFHRHRQKNKKIYWEYLKRNRSTEHIPCKYIRVRAKVAHNHVRNLI